MRSLIPHPLARIFASAAILSGLLATPADAQLTLEFKGGVLGDALDLSLSGGSAGSASVILPSFQPGPTPLSLIDPLDPRVLDVGLDLLGLATIGPVDATGAATASYAIPLAPALVGQTLYVQGFTVPGLVTFVDQLSNRIAFVLGDKGDVNQALSADVVRREFHTGNLLKDGRVLGLGGLVVGPSPAPVFTAASSIFDPQTQAFEPAGVDLPTPRARHRTVEFEDGRFMAIGGITPQGVSNQVTFVNPLTGLVQQGPPLNQARVMHTATVLVDGRVLVVGGSSDFTVPHPIGFPASTSTAIGTTEIYDPQSNAWTPGPSLPAPTTMVDAILLGSGKVLLIGGVVNVVGQGPAMTNACFLFDPTNDTIASTDSLPRGRIHTGNSRTADGNGLIAGGSTIDFGSQTSTVLNDVFLFNRTQETWSGLPPTPTAMRCGHIICVSDGMGGFYYIYGNGLRSLDLPSGAALYERNVYRIDGALASWTLVGVLNQDQMGAAMVPIDDGARVLFHGPGQGNLPLDTPTAEILIL